MDEIVKSPSIAIASDLLKKEYLYRKVASTIKESNGKVVFQHNEILVPEHWSQTSADILVHKYIRKAGVPFVSKFIPEDGIPTFFQKKEFVDNPEVPHSEQFGPETSAHQVFHRLAGCWTYWGLKSGYFNEKEAIEFYNDTYDSLYHQYAAPNSPQWFNTGLNWAYGISGDGSRAPLFHYDLETKSVVKTLKTYEHPQVHACFIQSIDDTLISSNGIMDLFLREATVFKYGSGSGTNYSSLRGKNEKLSGGGKSSGLMSFLKVGDSSAGAIKSGGTTRRAARMTVLDIDHPDIEEYITWKTDEENKAAALITGSILNKRLIKNIVAATTDEAFDVALAAAYAANVPGGLIQRAIQAHDNGYELDLAEFNSDWEGEAYATVSGQNANNSVSIPNKFMEILEADGDWDLIARKDKSVMKTVKAKKLWDDINYAAWASADPGIHFVDTMNDWNTVINDERIRATNPCSEYVFLDDTACNLASLNIVAIYNSDPKNFHTNLEKFARLWTTVLDISIQMAQFTSKKMAEKTFLYRTTGLGYANIGSFIMRQGLAYGSEAANCVISGITSLMTASAYAQSAVLAKKLEPFPRYAANKEPFTKVLNKHLSASRFVYDEAIGSLAKSLLVRANKLWALNASTVSGFRNAQVTVIAPTGTIGLVMDCDTTGIEPDFALVKHKKLAGGGYMKLINTAVPEALKSLGYSDNVTGEVVAFISGNYAFPGYQSIDPLTAEKFTEDRLMQYITGPDLLNFGVNKLTIFNTDIANFNSLIDVLEYFERTDSVDLGILKTRDQRYINTESYLFGYGNIDDCPFVKEEHKQVFACAVSAKADGVVIHPDEHLLAMAAAQPFVSGAISKTINMPSDATIADIHDINMKAYKLGLKCVSIYRDGSKLSQPLMTSIVEKLTKIINSQSPKPVAEEKVAAVVKVISDRGTRQRLPGKRTGYTQKAGIGGHGIYIHTGEYKDGKLGEIFLDMHKEGAPFRAMLNNFAIAVSIGLQYGVPLEEFVESFIRTKFEPSGPVQNHDNIKMSTSIIDYIFRDLAFNYLGREDLVQVKNKQPEVIAEIEGMKATITVTQNSDSSVDVTHTPKLEISRTTVYTGETCIECQSDRMVATGTCSTCQECGTTSGCS